MKILLLAAAAMLLIAITAFGIWEARLAARDSDTAERARDAERREPGEGESHAA